MYRIVAMDLDQTLLSRDKKLMGDFNGFIQSCEKHNIIPIIATGRGYYSAKTFISHWPLDIVCNNGNLIRNERIGSIEYINPIAPTDLHEILEHDTNERIQTSFHINGYDEGKDLAHLWKGKRNGSYAYVDKDEDRNLILSSIEELSHEVLSIVFTGAREELKILKESLNQEHGERFNLHLMKYQTKNCHMLEVLQKSGDKYIGVKEFAQRRNISMSQVIAIGDDSNDKLLIKKAGFGIAMKNGNEEVKDVADLISDKDNDEAGALDILNKVLKFGD